MTTSLPDTSSFQSAGEAASLQTNKNAFTVDVEEWFQVGAFENTLYRSNWVNLESRVALQTEVILSALETLNVKATFFCLGWVAERHPMLIQKIISVGHEIACHGLDHRRLFTMNRDEFRSDLAKSKYLIESASGQAVKGYRAPSFSLTTDTWWVYEELAEAGFTYSSSLYPVKTDHYGADNIPRVPFFPTDAQTIVEIPMTVYDSPIRRLPASGGGYFRLLPYWVSKFMFKSAIAQTDMPVMFYMHPWEADPAQPYIKEAPLLSRFRHYTNQGKMLKKIGKLCDDFSWDRIDRVYQELLP